MALLKIIPIPAFETNYLWLGVDESTHAAFAVDPGDAKPILDYLQSHAITLTTILITHKHADHIGGVAELLRAYPNIPVYTHAQEKIAQATHWVDEGDTISLAYPNITFRVLHIPGHTLGHVAYVNDEMAFVGDTLFAGGCGRVFEGTPAQMLSSLEKLAALNTGTKIYCAHEYTLSNLKFAAMVEPQNSAIQHRLQIVQSQRAKNTPTIPFSIAVEKETNPFLRCDQLAVIQAAEKYAHHTLGDGAAVFQVMREWKNNL